MLDVFHSYRHPCFVPECRPVAWREAGPLGLCFSGAAAGTGAASRRSSLPTAKAGPLRFPCTTASSGLAEGAGTAPSSVGTEHVSSSPRSCFLPRPWAAPSYMRVHLPAHMHMCARVSTQVNASGSSRRPCALSGLSPVLRLVARSCCLVLPDLSSSLTGGHCSLSFPASGRPSPAGRGPR